MPRKGQKACPYCGQKCRAAEFWVSAAARPHIRIDSQGEKRGDLPVQRPTKYDLIINQNGDTLGHTIRPPLFAHTNELSSRAAMPRKFFVTFTCVSLVVASFGVKMARAQVVIPHGSFENDFESYLVVIVSFILLCFAVWRFFRRR